ncbi:unnamed protein product [Brachionus calyciflorus]|uniref:Tc1-like transposase DDE domain-containing protein n=1 Tax=Brachionus calyciflorus TaxID=104777 RepID=A0A814MWG6_9BILA|nr:unnamed protein product [Brachionus calyciflorus]
MFQAKIAFLIRNDYIFVDETMIRIFEKPIYHLRLPTCFPKALPSTSKFACKLNIWGGISYKGPTEFAVFKENMDSQMYTEILGDFLFPFGARMYDFHFNLHQDNDPKHNSLLCRNFLDLNGVSWIKSPPKSPDLNPIELVWNELKNFVRKKEISNELDLFQAINDFQKTLTVEKCKSYVGHLKKVVKIVIKRNGGWSDH